MAKSKTTSGTVAKTYQEILAEVTSKLKELQETKQLNELDAQVLVDKWSTQDPFAIIGFIAPDAKYKYGQMLSWRNPQLRDKSAAIGWAGWIPLEYDDPYAGANGELLTQYLLEIPARLEGTTKLDRYVRRGDSVLCRLPTEAWQRRQLDREANYLEMRNQLKKPQVTPGQSVSGIDGTFEDQKPGNRMGRVGGFAPEEDEIKTDEGHISRSTR